MTVAQLRRLLDDCPAHLQVGLFQPAEDGNEFIELVDALHVVVEHPERRPWEFLRLVAYTDPDSKVR